MRFTNKIKYNLKRMLPLVVAGAGLMNTACSKDDEIIEEVKPTHDVSLRWDLPFWHTHLDDIDNIKKLADDKTVLFIFLDLKDSNDCSSYDETVHYQRLREYMQPRFDVSPKVRGRGNFNNVLPNVMSRSDSLWFVEKGWTINKHQR